MVNLLTDLDVYGMPREEFLERREALKAEEDEEAFRSQYEEINMVSENDIVSLHFDGKISHTQVNHLTESKFLRRSFLEQIKQGQEIYQELRENYTDAEIIEKVDSWDPATELPKVSEKLKEVEGRYRPTVIEAIKECIVGEYRKGARIKRGLW